MVSDRNERDYRTRLLELRHEPTLQRTHRRVTSGTVSGQTGEWMDLGALLGAIARAAWDRSVRANAYEVPVRTSSRSEKGLVADDLAIGQPGSCQALETDLLT